MLSLDNVDVITNNIESVIRVLGKGDGGMLSYVTLQQGTNAIGNTTS